MNTNQSLWDGFRTNDLIAVYFNKYATDHFVAGRLLLYDNNYILLSLLAPDLIDDGLLLICRKQIFRIEFDSSYLRELANKAKSHDNSLWEGDPWDALLAYAEKYNKLIQVSYATSNRSVFCFSIDHSGKSITAQCVSRNGTLGKKRRLSSIKLLLVGCNSSEEQTVQHRFQERNVMNG